jgi:hypothetical protein
MGSGVTLGLNTKDDRSELNRNQAIFTRHSRWLRSLSAVPFVALFEHFDFTIGIAFRDAVDFLQLC